MQRGKKYAYIKTQHKDKDRNNIQGKQKNKQDKN